MPYRLQEATGLINRLRFHAIGADRWPVLDVLDHGFDYLIDPSPKYNLWG